MRIQNFYFIFIIVIDLRQNESLTESSQDIFEFNKNRCRQELSFLLVEYFQ